jgi:hypothetical protein
MSLLVSLEVPALWKPFMTFFTLIRSLSCMSSNVDLESTAPHESMGAIGALKWPFTGVASHVVSQMTLCGELFPTILDNTHEWLLSWVDSKVSFKVAFLCEGLITPWPWAFEWFFSSLSRGSTEEYLYMSSGMNFQSAWSAVAFSTDFTCEGLVTRMDKFMGL